MSDTISPVAMSIAADAVNQQANAGGHLSLSGAPPRGGAIDAKQVDAAVERLNTSLQSLGTKLSFSVDRQTKDIVITVHNSETGEVIRQIPPESMLRVSEHIEELLGVLFDAEG